MWSRHHGYDKGGSAIRPSRFVNVYRVVSNLGVFDFGGPDHSIGRSYTG